MESLENYYLKYSYLSTSSLIKYYKSIKDIDPFQEEIFKQYSQKELLQFLINPLYDFYSITINELEKYLTNHPQFSNSNNLIPYRIEKTPFSLLIYFYNYLLFHDILKDFQPLLIDNIYNEFKIYKKFPIIFNQNIEENYFSLQFCPHIDFYKNYFSNSTKKFKVYDKKFSLGECLV